MPRPKNAKVWNEDLANALQSRQLLAQRLGKRNEHLYRDGYNAIVAVRNDIYCFSNGRVVNLPQNLKKTVFNLCMDVIRGVQEIYPDGYYENNPTQNNGQPLEKNWDNDPYLRQMKNRSGPYAILRTFDHAGVDTLTKAQIMSIGQQFCDEQMDSNYMAGRTYGAWKGKDTLKKHGLVTENGAARTFEEGRGFRTLGVNTYNLTRDGQKFIAAMKRKWPQDFVGGSVGGGVTGGNGGGGGGVAATASFASPRGRHRFEGGTPGLATPSTVARRAGSLGEQDEQELRQWVAFANIGDEKAFRVGKDRRQHLHNVCDQLEAEMPGLRLAHESNGASRSRELVVEILYKDGAASVARAAGSKHTFDDSFEESPTKHARRVPPSVAAAQAAERRLEEQRALKKEEDEMERALKASLLDQAAKSTQSPGISAEDDNLEKAIELSLAESEQKPAARPQRTRQDEIDELLASSSDEDEDFQRAVHRSIRESKRSSKALSVSEVGLADSKPPARRELFKRADKEVVDMLSDDDDSDEDGYVVLSPMQPAPSPSSKASAEDQEVICLDESQEQDVIEIDESQGDNIQYSNESQESVVVLDEQVEPLYATAERSTPLSIRPKVTLLIDNRERNRNVTPRELRMQLTYLVTQGAIHTLWPSGMPVCEVQEASLPIGDFVFEVEKTLLPQSSQSKRLAIAVERKRVGDLVQRSVGGDHWQQFLRMRDSMHHSVFLVEHDTRSASRFTAYGSQNLDGWNPLGTLIEDEQAIFLFFGRAMLSSRSTKFIQTKDEQASLRAVGALGLVASLSDDANLVSDQVASAQDAPTALKDKLIKCGIPWQLVRHVSKILSSLKYANACYAECTDDECRSQLLVPFIDETTFGAFSSTKEGWSEAVYRALTSDASNAPAAKLLLEDNKDAVSDHGKFLSALYSGAPLQDAIEGSLHDPVSAKASSRRRKVMVEIQEKHAGLFPQPESDENCFFALSLTASNPLDVQVDTIIIQTEDGPFTSDRLFVHLLPAKKLVTSIKDAMPAPGAGGDYMSAAKDVASSVNNDCYHETMISGRDRRVVLLCGLGPALDAVAKHAGYRTEIRAMVDIVVAQLMVAHDLVVIQSVRLKGDNEMIVQQLALACFHYHMLPNKK